MTRPRRRTIGRPLPVFTMRDHDEMTGCTAWDDWARREALLRHIAANLPEVLDAALCAHIHPDRPPAWALDAHRRRR